MRGKTTFLASELSHMASQTDGEIYWFNNEEQGNKVMLRVYEAYFGLSLRDIVKDIWKYREEFKNSIGARLRMFDSSSISKWDIENILKSGKPALAVIDQLDKVKGFLADRPDLRFGAIYQWTRELAKEYCPIIGVCQASGEAEGVRWLTMDHVAEAKTAKQSEADFILGIGKTHDQNLEYVRHINISKNKLVGDEDTDPSLKHGRFDVIIDPLRARYKDI